MIQRKDLLPRADIPEIYQSDPYRLDEGSPLSLVEEEARNQKTQDQKTGTVRKHLHDGNTSELIPFRNISGLLKIVSAVPTGVPSSAWEQIVLYSSGGTRRIYFYVTDSVGTGAWRYAALT